MIGNFDDDDIEILFFGKDIIEEDDIDINMQKNITAVEDDEGMNGVKLIDAVQLLHTEPSEEFGWHCTSCSCVETVKDFTRQCTSPSIDGYVSQTLLSMENLYYLCEQHERTCYSGFNDSCELDQTTSCCFENDLAARIPLLG